MNYKVAIDASHGGTDSGYTANGIIEKDYSLLISNYIKNRLDDLGVFNIITRNTDRTLSDDDRVNIITSSFGNDSNVIVLSNILNKGGGEGLEVIYALRNNDKLASSIYDEVVSAGGVASKYYQLRDPDDTVSDYYSIIRNTPNYETIVVSYGNVDNLADVERIKNDYSDYAEAVVKALASYIGVSYVPISGSNYYVVKKGDSLWKIANSYGTSVDELKLVNNLKSNLLNIGQVLLIPKDSVSSDEVLYVVKKGDSLWKIANSYGISVNDLKRANNLKSDLLSIGQKLIIPSVSYSNYVVKKGDSLWKIANNYGTSVDELKKVNSLETNLLQIGQVLKVPLSWYFCLFVL